MLNCITWTASSNTFLSVTVTVIATLFVQANSTCTSMPTRILVRYDWQYITSQSYPSNYPNYANCLWRLEASAGQIIQVRIWQPLKIVDSHRCRLDNLTIIDGWESDGEILKTVCGAMNNTSFYSSGSVMSLKFMTDYTITDKGFKLAYRVAQNSVYPAQCDTNDYTGWIRASYYTQSYITSPGFPRYDYPSESRCSWIIKGQSGYRIHIHLDVLDLEIDEECRYDALFIYDGDSRDYPLLAKLCSRPQDSWRRNFYNSGSRRHMLIHFRSDYGIQAEGFKISYTLVLPSMVKEDVKEEDEAATGPNTGYFVGAVMGTMVGVVGVCCICIFYRSKLHRRHTDSAPVLPSNGHASTTRASGQGQGQGQENLAHSPPAYDELELSGQPAPASVQLEGNNAAQTSGVADSGASSGRNHSRSVAASGNDRDVFSSDVTSGIPDTPPPVYDDVMLTKYPPTAPPVE